jgi:hypothetical protein
MRSRWAAAVAPFLIAAAGPAIAGGEIAVAPAQTCWVHEKEYPDPRCTPGLTDDQQVNQTTISLTICMARWTDEKRTKLRGAERLAERLLKTYGLAKDRDAYELDHFVPLGLGGANDERNLWLEQYNPTPGARQKDSIEGWLNRQVCPPPRGNGRMALKDAQTAVKECWLPLWEHVYGSRKQQPWNAANSVDAGEGGAECLWLAQYTSQPN